MADWHMIPGGVGVVVAVEGTRELLLLGTKVHLLYTD